MLSWRALASGVVWLLCATQVWALDGGRYGDVHFASPAGTTRGYVVLFSDIGGWTAADDAALQSLVHDGAMVVGVDTQRYLANIAGGKRDCDQLVGDAEGLSRQLQRRYGHEAYWFPILAGVGAGGTVAWVTLSEAPGNTLSGAVSVDPAPVLSGPRPLCPGAASRRVYGGFEYQAVPSLSGFWRSGISPNASVATVAHLQWLANHGTPVSVESVMGAPQVALAGLTEAQLHARASVGVSALPLVALPAAKPSRTMAVVLTGDGGWRDLDKTIAGYLQGDGVPVVGWDCVRYFWRRQSPEQAASDLATTLNHYMQLWGASDVVLIGYSFGADVLPAMYNRLPPDLKQHVRLLSLLGLADKADWEIQVTGWLGAAPSAGATPTGPELAQIAPQQLQCFYGSEESDSPCPALGTRGAQAVRMTGGHHFGADYRGIERQILATLQQPAAR